MGNRAVIRGLNQDMGVYVHWNGGYDSVLAFTQYCKLKGYRSPETDSYGLARLAQVIGNFFGGGLSLGLWNMSDTKELTPKIVEDMWLDNGVYEIRNWEIVKHWDPDIVITEPEISEYELKNSLLCIDSCMPESEKLGKDFLSADVINTSELKIGDKVFVYDQIYGKYELQTVIGFGDTDWLNGRNVKGKPYTDRYEERSEGNINAYILTDKIRKI